jgi:MFS transporter, DHA2 family, multidrug resistance protein
VQGIGMCLFFVSVLNIILDGIEPLRIPSASGLSNFLRIMGGAIATSIVTTFWERHANFHQTRLAEATSLYDPRAQHALETLRNSGLSEQQALAALTHELEAQAYLLAALDYFWIVAWVTFAAIAFIWLARRPHTGQVVAAE